MLLVLVYGYNCSFYGKILTFLVKRLHCESSRLFSLCRLTFLKTLFCRGGVVGNKGAIMNGGDPISLSTKIEKVKTATLRPAVTDQTSCKIKIVASEQDAVGRV